MDIYKYIPYFSKNSFNMRHQVLKFKKNHLAVLLFLSYFILKLYTSFTPKAIQSAKTVNVTGDNNSVNKIQVSIHPKIKCHYSTQNDALPSMADPNFSPGVEPIFFHETSCRGGITNRQACVIESAARLHPKRQINLLFSAPITEFRLNNSNLVHLLKIKNIKMYRLHIEQYAEGTIVESILRTQIKKSLYPVQHLADILRMVTLNKFGGMYLDTDSFIIKNLDSLPPNWIAEEYNASISSGAMKFSIDGLGHNLTSTILSELYDTYYPKSWSSNGPKAIHRVLERICLKAVLENGNCKGLQIFPSEDFYPVHYSYAYLYFKNGNLDNLYKSYMHHTWNSMTRNMQIEKYSPFAILAEKFCPSMFGTYGKEFGQ